jgi:hypothetical protein
MARRARAVRYGLAACLLVVTAGAAVRAAGDESEPVHLEYRAADGCPDRAAFEARVRARTARARFVAGEGRTRTFVVELKAGAAPSGRFAVSRGGEAEGSRDVHADTCAERSPPVAGHPPVGGHPPIRPGQS